MSGSCARSECRELAAFWYLALPATQVVEVFSQEQSHCVALCKTHFDRFSLPSGWQFKRAALRLVATPSSTDVERHAKDDGDDAALPPRSEASNSRQPWFVREDDETSTEIDYSEQPVASGGIGLLERAFNGPRAISEVRANDADSSDVGSSPLEAETVNRATNQTILNQVYEMERLPFPPATAASTESD